MEILYANFFFFNIYQFDSKINLYFKELIFTVVTLISYAFLWNSSNITLLKYLFSFKHHLLQIDKDMMQN